MADIPQVRHSPQYINQLIDLMRRIIPAIAALAFLISFSVNVRLANAQKHKPEEKDEQFEENHQAEIQEWYKEYTNPLNEPNIAERRAEGLKQLLSMSNRSVVHTAATPAWVPVGTSQAGNISGRATCISFDPTDKNDIYLGTSQGGLWRTTDGGTNWVSLSDGWISLATGGVAVDPNNPAIIYAGLGDPFGVAASGVYKSTDYGLNWSLLTTSTSPATQQMLVNPANSNFVYQAGTTGVYLSQDAGVTWTRTAAISGVTTIVFDPNDPSIIYASGGSAIKKSYDSGKTWVALSGFKAGSLMTMAISPKNSAIVYLSTASGSTSYLSRSTDSGATWTTMNTTTGYLGTQGFYANAIAVNPLNADNVIVGGLDIYSSTNGGKILTKRTDWTSNSSFSDFSHADIHVLVYNEETLYTLSDGGIYYSQTNGNSWEQDMNKTLATFQFVGGDAEPNLKYFVAGAQDNGVNKIQKGETYFTQIYGGDGGTSYVGQDGGGTIYSTYLGAVLYRSDDEGRSFASGTGGGVNLLANCGIEAEAPGGYMEYGICESDPAVVAVCGTRNVYLSTAGASDNPVAITTSGQISGGPRCVNIATADPDYIYIGGANAVYYSTDQGETITKSATKVGSPSAITTDPNDPTHVYMVVGGTASNHFYVSTDNGQTWVHPATTTLPALNYKRIAVTSSGKIFIGGDYGVVHSDDGGSTWEPLLQGLPLVQITSLHVRDNDQSLVATTYGRGMFTIDISKLPPVNSGSGVVAANPLLIGSTPAITSVYPNPVTASSAHSNVRYTLPSDGQAVLAVYDVLGRQERILVNEFGSKGEHTKEFDLSGIPAGRHFLMLTAMGANVTEPITIQ